ncbi:MAG: MoaD/ThiS family protein [Candidatus Neomarinimicrobiota bacterium]
MPGTIHVNLICFSLVKYALGKDQLSVELPAGATTDELEAHVRELAGDALPTVPLRVAVNQRYAPAGAALSDGDEVVFIPPVQGG